jgi:hypothetical protein
MEIIDVNSCWFPWTHTTFAFYNNFSLLSLVQVRLASSVTENIMLQLFGVNIVVFELLYFSLSELLVLSTIPTLGKPGQTPYFLFFESIAKASRFSTGDVVRPARWQVKRNVGRSVSMPEEKWEIWCLSRFFLHLSELARLNLH